MKLVFSCDGDDEDQDDDPNQSGKNSPMLALVVVV